MTKVGAQVMDNDKRRNKALQYIRNGQYQQALKALEQLTRLVPGDADAWFLLGNLYQQCSDHEKSAASLRKVIALGKASAEVYYALGNALYDLNQVEEARDQYLQAIKLEPDHVGILINLANCYNRLGTPSDAIQCLNQAMQIAPDNSSIYGNLGNTLKALGHHQQALDAFQIGLKLDPDNYRLIMNLGVLLLEVGHTNEARQCFLKVIRIKPDLPEAYSNLGNLVKNEFNYRDAIIFLEKALSLKPDFTEANHNYAAALYELGEVSDAEARFRQVLARNPSFFEAETALVQALKMQGKFDMALNQLQEMECKYKGNHELLAQTVSVLERKGDIQAAINLIKPAYEMNPNDPYLAVQMVALCKKAGNCEQATASLEKILADESQYLSQKTRINANFTLGKAFDAMGQYERAFAHYDTGNKLKSMPLDREQFSQRIDQIIAKYTPDYFAAHAMYSDNSSRPVFIVGMPRSGTSLVEQILSSHAEITGAGELPDIGRHATTLAKQMHENGPDAESGFVSALQDVASQYLAKLAEFSDSTTYVTDKMPQNFLHLGLIAMLFPHAHIIHTVRDPADTCLSCFFQDFVGLHAYSYDLADCGFYYRQYQRLMQHWNRVLPVKIHNVVYEDLISDTEAETRSILDYLGLEWDDNCLNFHKSSRAVVTASYDQVRQPVYQSSVGRWKHYQQHLAPLLIELGHDQAALRAAT